MERILDCRGLACPHPVLSVKAALESGVAGGLTVLVNDEAARENVKRFAENQGCSVSAQEVQVGTWQLRVHRGGTCAAPFLGEGRAASVAKPAQTVVLVLSDRIGPDGGLGAVLMKAFLGTLVQAAEKPSRILFLNTGILLTTEESPVLDVIGELEKTGVEILSCGTCLEFLDRRDRLRVGRVTNMYETVETLMGPSKIVSVQ